MIPEGTAGADFWDELLLGAGRPGLEGSVLFACSDEAIEFMATRRQELARFYRLDDHIATQQIALLDKQETIRLAASVGVPTPRQWAIDSLEDLDRIGAMLDFPALVRPVHSHLFLRVYHKKLLVVRDLDELRNRLEEVLGHGLEVMVCELIPGPDTLLSSYYTYIDPQDEHLFHFTKRVIRRSPPQFGAGVYHITEWLPETAEMGQRFFRGIGFRGLGNIEFKRDPRDGRLKIIEVNARFTAAQELLVRSGMDIAWIIYNHIIGRRLPPVDRFTEHLRLWYPSGDFDALRDLRAQGELTIPQWLRSIAHRHVLPFFSVTDPMPALAKGRDTFRRRILRHVIG